MKQKNVEKNSQKTLYGLQAFFAKYRTIIVYSMLAFIVLVGAWIRLSGIYTNSFAFTYDVGRDMLTLRQIVLDHNIPLIGPTTGLAGLFYGPWWYYILTVPFFLAHGNPQGVALFMALAGVVSIILAYYFGRKLEGELLGLILAGLVSFSQYFIGLSVQIWNPNIAPILLLFLLISLYRLFTQQKSSFFLLLFMGIILGLMLDVEIVFGMLLLLSLFVFFIVFRRDRLFLRQMLLVPLGIFVMVSPRVLFEFRHQFIMTSTLIRSFSESREPAVYDFLGTFVTKLLTYFNLFSETVSAGNGYIALFVLIFVFVTLLNYYRNASFLQKTFIKLSVTVIFVFFVAINFFPHAIWGHYLVGVPIFYVLLVGICFFLFARNSKFGLLALLFVIILFWVNLKPVEVVSNLTKPIWEGDAAVYRNQLSAIDYVYNDANGKQFNYTAYSPAVYGYNYDYLFLWYGKQKYGYSPMKDSSDLFYVVLEPDYEYPSRLIDWLKIREDDGKVKMEKTVKGGIVVQTRVR